MKKRVADKDGPCTEQTAAIAIGPLEFDVDMARAQGWSLARINKFWREAEVLYLARRPRRVTPRRSAP